MVETLARAVGVTRRFGEVTALHGVSLDVPAGQLLGLLGPNGAGKSTLLSVIAGLVRSRAGRVLLEGRDLSSLPAHARARAGIAFVPEGRRIFPRQTVDENLLIGAYACVGDKAWRQEAFQWVFELFPVLERKRRKVAGTLSGGEQQMLAVAQAIMGKPRILLLDEPSAGLAPALVKQMLERVRRLHERGVSLLMVEQVVASALAVADYVYVMRNGEIVAQGAPNALSDQEFGSSYLGAGI